MFRPCCGKCDCSGEVAGRDAGLCRKRDAGATRRRAAETPLVSKHLPHGRCPGIRREGETDQLPEVFGQARWTKNGKQFPFWVDDPMECWNRGYITPWPPRGSRHARKGGVFCATRSSPLGPPEVLDQVLDGDAALGTKSAPSVVHNQVRELVLLCEDFEFGGEGGTIRRTMLDHAGGCGFAARNSSAAASSVKTWMP